MVASAIMAIRSEPHPHHEGRSGPHVADPRERRFLRHALDLVMSLFAANDVAGRVRA